MKLRTASLAILALAAGCKGEPACTRCDTIVVAATGEPSSLLPPLVVETVGRDISDQLFERLADLAPGGAPVDSTAFRPRLADKWERIDSLSWRFHIRAGARWQDGQPVTARDVAFSFSAYTDSLLDSPASGELRGRVKAEAENEQSVRISFDRYYPEQLYDATWHVRVFPAHIWDGVPRNRWADDTTLSHLVGSGPYRIESWQRGQALTLVSDTSGAPRTRVRRAVWRFASDPEAALNLVLSGEADLMESVGSPERVTRVEQDSLLHAVRYPSAAFGFLGYRVQGNPLLGDRALRRALNQAVDRSSIATAVYGPGAVAPPGPMSKLLWIWDDAIAVLPYDTAAAAHAFDAAGYTRGADGVRHKGSRKVAFDILVPSTSTGRRRLAEALQEQWRQAGVTVTVTAVDFPVFMERLHKGAFDSYIGAWLDEPSARVIPDQWGRGGIGSDNYGGYLNPVVERLFGQAMAEPAPAAARAAWRAALDTLNADAPALFLYTPVQVAAVSRRVENFSIDPYSWLAALSSVTLKP
ncbi:MAG TPA: peptide ABC transporter substrate-binding protein [Gemmatimonadales bacterium]|nr:peptide ABC transporter substrate-binding protein [Gemmatimonadales bacterium]